MPTVAHSTTTTCTHHRALFAHLLLTARAQQTAHANCPTRAPLGLAALLQRRADARGAGGVGTTGSGASEEASVVTPFERMQHCRDALEFLDTKGWNRSFHQRLFHEDFLVCVCVGHKEKSEFGYYSGARSLLSLIYGLDWS
jgi:hypothetical protein